MREMPRQDFPVSMGSGGPLHLAIFSGEEYVHGS